MKKIVTLSFLSICLLIFTKMNGQDTLRNIETQHFYNNLKAFTKSEFTMFGMANALTISYSGGPKHAFNDRSDAKDITGSHPAMIESDFMWYGDDANFRRNDTIAMREAYKRGAVTAYANHLRGRDSKSFYAKVNSKFTADSALVKNILASANRDTNVYLDWYLDHLDNMVIPIFKGLGFPIIYRPFHEMTGGWFWWGTETCTAEEFKAIWKLTIDYMRKAGLKNVLYAWAPDKSADTIKLYPGDDYVDIIGYDGYEIGIESYHSTAFYTRNVGTLSHYARTHDKAFAITETGHEKFPGKHPDYWLTHVLQPIKKNAKAKHAAWVMSWYNADWSNNKTSVSWIPYLGIESVHTNGQESIDEFMKFYDDPRTIFLNEVPSLYISDDSSAFILPKTLKFATKDSLRLLGGSKNNWANETPSWKSSDPTVISVDGTGLVRVLKNGTADIIVTTPDGKSSDTCKVQVDITVSVSQLNTDEIKIYPNPSNGENINFNFGMDNGVKRVMIYNVAGKELLSFTTSNTLYTLNNRKLEPGFYVASIQNGKQNFNKSFLVK